MSPNFFWRLRPIPQLPPLHSRTSIPPGGTRSGTRFLTAGTVRRYALPRSTWSRSRAFGCWPAVNNTIVHNPAKPIIIEVPIRFMNSPAFHRGSRAEVRGVAPDLRKSPPVASHRAISAARVYRKRALRSTLPARRSGAVLQPATFRTAGRTPWSLPSTKNKFVSMVL